MLLFSDTINSFTKRLTSEVKNILKEEIFATIKKYGKNIVALQSLLYGTEGLNIFGNAEVKKSTFLNYSSQKITASSTDKKILLQIVEAIDTKDLSNIMKKLEDEITAVDEERVYFNPYEGENVVYSVPDEFKYIREKTSKDGLPQHYYIVYGNDIFSYFIFSEEQIRFKGIASVFSCKNNVYKIDIFSEVDSFNKDELLNELANFYCL